MCPKKRSRRGGGKEGRRGDTQGEKGEIKRGPMEGAETIEEGEGRVEDHGSKLGKLPRGKRSEAGGRKGWLQVKKRVGVRVNKGGGRKR